MLCIHLTVLEEASISAKKVSVYDTAVKMSILAEKLQTCVTCDCGPLQLLAHPGDGADKIITQHATFRGRVQRGG